MKKIFLLFLLIVCILSLGFWRWLADNGLNVSKNSFPRNSMTL